jgi:hypothetical protein
MEAVMHGSPVSARPGVNQRPTPAQVARALAIYRQVEPAEYRRLVALLLHSAGLMADEVAELRDRLVVLACYL